MNKKTLFLCMFLHSITFASQQTRKAIVRPMCEQKYNALGTSGTILGIFIEQKDDGTFCAWHHKKGSPPTVNDGYNQFALENRYNASGKDHECTLEVPISRT